MVTKGWEGKGEKRLLNSSKAGKDEPALRHRDRGLCV